VVVEFRAFVRSEREADSRVAGRPAYGAQVTIRTQAEVLAEKQRLRDDRRARRTSSSLPALIHEQRCLNRLLTMSVRVCSSWCGRRRCGGCAERCSHA
jgi:hypothetical protein